MPLLKTRDMKVITSIINKYNGTCPEWLYKIKKVQKVLNKKNLHGGETLSQGQSIQFGNFKVGLIGKYLEFYVAKPLNKSNELSYKNSSNRSWSRSEMNYPKSELGGNPSWLCELPNDNGFLNRGWWFKYIYRDVPRNLCIPPKKGPSTKWNVKKINNLKRELIKTMMENQPSAIYGSWFPRWINMYWTFRISFSGTYTYDHIAEFINNGDNYEERLANENKWVRAKINLKWGRLFTDPSLTKA